MQRALAASANSIANCVQRLDGFTRLQRCATSAKTLVFQMANPEADVMFSVGPGREVDSSGHAILSARAGQLLDRMLAAIG